MRYRSLARRVGNAMRLAEVVQVLVRHGFADLVNRAGLHDGLPARVLRGMRLIQAPPREPSSRGQQLRAALTELGPTFVKFGQILSTRPDLVGKRLADDLGDLQDKVAPTPFDAIRPVIETELSATLEDLFEEFPTEPVAAASLSQVYRARTKKGGDLVAVKVQRPGIRQVIESDLNLMHSVAEWLAEHVHDFQWMDPVGVVEEFRRSILRELDFTIEARVIERFRKNYQGQPTVFVPRIYPELSAQRVLTMDWIDGVRVDAVHEYTSRRCDPKTVAANGCDTLCKQVFEHHLFHADPHPGNILVIRNNQLAFLDYGMVGRLDQGDVIAMAELLHAILEQDSSRCLEALLVFTTTSEVADPRALEHEIAEYAAFEAESMLSGGRVGKAIDRVIAILQRHNLRLAPRFSLLLKALATIETTAHVLDPNLNMTPIIRPYVERAVMRQYAPDQLIGDMRRNALVLARLARDIPSDVSRLLRMLRRGELKIQLNHEKLARIAAVTDLASNRITVGLITGALIVGSSLLISIETGARGLGLAGFTAAGFLGLALVISILRSKNY